MGKENLFGAFYIKYFAIKISVHRSMLDFFIVIIQEFYA